MSMALDGVALLFGALLCNFRLLVLWDIFTATGSVMEILQLALSVSKCRCPLWMQPSSNKPVAQLEIYHLDLFLIMGSQCISERGSQEILVLAPEPCQPYQVALSGCILGISKDGDVMDIRSMGPLGPRPVFDHSCDDFQLNFI